MSETEGFISCLVCVKDQRVVSRHQFSHLILTTGLRVATVSVWYTRTHSIKRKERDVDE